MRAGPSTAHRRVGHLADRALYAIVGRTATGPAWWQIRYGTGTGWVHGAYVETLGDLLAVPVPAAWATSPAPAVPPATGVQAAQGPYLNLAENRDGHWTVRKQDTRVRATFRSTCSPVQYYARQGPEDLLVLPAGFRPAATQRWPARRARHVLTDGWNHPGPARHEFDMRAAPDGAVRYKDCSGGWNYERVCTRNTCWKPVEECKTERDCSGASWKCLAYKTEKHFNYHSPACMLYLDCKCTEKRVCARSITVPCTEKQVCRDVMKKATCTECKTVQTYDPCKTRRHRSSRHIPMSRPTRPPTPTATPKADSRQIGKGGDDTYTDGDFNTCRPEQIRTGDSCLVPGGPSKEECSCGSYCEDNGRSCWCNTCKIGGNPTPTPVRPVATPTPTATLTPIPTATLRTEPKPNPTATPTRDRNRPKTTATPRPRPTPTPRTGIILPPVEQVLVPPPPPVQWDAQAVREEPVITGRPVQWADRLLMTAQGAGRRTPATA